MQIPDAEVKALAPKRFKCGRPGLSETRSADEAAAHGIKMKAMGAAEEAEVRPDCVVCCAGVTSSDQCSAGTPPRGAEERGGGGEGASGLCALLCKRDYVLMLCRNSAVRRRCVRTLWSAVQARLCSDALQELRREQKRKVEEEKVRPDFVVCCAGATMF